MLSAFCESRSPNVAIQIDKSDSCSCFKDATGSSPHLTRWSAAELSGTFRRHKLDPGQSVNQWNVSESEDEKGLFKSLQHSDWESHTRRPVKLIDQVWSNTETWSGGNGSERTWLNEQVKKKSRKLFDKCRILLDKQRFSPLTLCCPLTLWHDADQNALCSKAKPTEGFFLLSSAFQKNPHTSCAACKNDPTLQ